MFPWLIIIPSIVIGKLIHDACTEDEPVPQIGTSAPSTLARNLSRLGRELDSPAGGRRVAVLGQPGAGKSSMLRKLSADQMRPLPAVGVNTDATNWSDNLHTELVSHWRGVRFADVPGYDTASHPLSDYLRHFPFHTFDAFVLVLNGKLHAADRAIHDAMTRRNPGAPVLVVRSFAESLDDDGYDTGHSRRRAESDIRQHLGCGHQAPLVMASNRTGQGLTEVRQWLRL